MMVNPILTGLFETKFLLGGGVNLTPLPDLGVEAAKFCMDVKTHLKSIATKKKIAENGLYIMLYYNLCKLFACFHKFINISN